MAGWEGWPQPIEGWSPTLSVGEIQEHLDALAGEDHQQMSVFELASALNSRTASKTVPPDVLAYVLALCIERGWTSTPKWEKAIKALAANPRLPVEVARAVLNQRPALQTKAKRLAVEGAVMHPGLSFDEAYASAQANHAQAMVEAMRREDVTADALTSVTHMLLEAGFAVEANPKNALEFMTRNPLMPADALHDILVVCANGRKQQPGLLGAIEHPNTPEDAIAYYLAFGQIDHYVSRGWTTFEALGNSLRKRFPDGVPEHVRHRVIEGDSRDPHGDILSSAIRVGVFGADDVREMLDHANPEVWGSAERYIADNPDIHLGVEKTNTPALEMIRQNPNWRRLTPESNEVKLALALYPNLGS